MKKTLVLLLLVSLFSSCMLDPSLEKGELRTDTQMPFTGIVILDDVTYLEEPLERGISTIRWEPIDKENREKVGYTKQYWLYVFTCDEEGIFLEHEVRGFLNEPFTVMYYRQDFEMPEFNAENVSFVEFSFSSNEFDVNEKYFSKTDNKDIISILFSEPKQVNYTKAISENRYGTVGYLSFRNIDLVGIHVQVPIRMIENSYWLGTEDSDYYIEISQETLESITGVAMPVPQEYWELNYEEREKLLASYN